MDCQKILTQVFLTALFIAAPLVANAQIRFLHDSQSLELPTAGAELNVKVILQGARSADQLMEVEAIRDGKLVHLVIPEGHFNKQEQLFYEFSIASPTAGLGYRFKIKDTDGKMYQSQYYFVLQECEHVPALEAANIDMPANQIEQASAIAQKAVALERQLENYSFIAERLTTLRTLFEEENQ